MITTKEKNKKMTPEERKQKVKDLSKEHEKYLDRSINTILYGETIGGIKAHIIKDIKVQGDTTLCGLHELSLYKVTPQNSNQVCKTCKKIHDKRGD